MAPLAWRSYWVVPSMHAQLSNPANSCKLLVTFGFYFSVLVSVWLETSVEKLLQVKDKVLQAHAWSSSELRVRNTQRHRFL